MTEVRFYDPLYEPDAGLTYSVIVARFIDKWLFVRHGNRDTWEIAGGHIESSESSSDAASRELREEIGAGKFNIKCVATYSVLKDGSEGYGRLYFAEVFELTEIPDISEIAEITFLDHLPEKLTYPDIQPHLFTKTVEYLKEEGML